MIKFPKIMSVSLAVFLLTGCHNQENTAHLQQSPSAPKVVEIKNTLTGEWNYHNSLCYSSKLVLHKDGSFTFHDHGCYGQKFSEGKWTNRFGTIALASFDSFKLKKQDNAIEPAAANKSDESNSKKKNSKSEYSFIGLKKVTLPVFHGSNDTIPVYLDNVQLELRNDTLYCIGANKLPEEAKFYRSKQLPATSTLFNHL